MQTNFKSGNLIYEKRKEKQLTQKQLGAALGVTNKAVSKWEVGTSIPDQGLLVPLANLLDITVEELLVGEKSENKEIFIKVSSLNEKEILSSLRYLTKEARLFLVMCLVFVIYGILLLLMNHWGWEGNQPYNHSFYITFRVIVPIVLYLLFVLLSTSFALIEIMRYNIYKKIALIGLALFIFVASIIVFIPKMIRLVVMQRIFIKAKKQMNK